MPQSNRLRGMLYMVLAVAVLSFMDAALKILSPHYSALQITAMRGVASLPFAFMLVLRGTGLRQVLQIRWGLQLLRGALSILTLSALIFALQQLSLAEAYCIFFSAPLLIAVFSIPILGERMEWQRWVAVLVGLLGVVWMLRPQGQELPLAGVLAALVATLGYVFAALTLRVIARTDSSAVSTFWFLVMLAIGAGIMTGGDWRMPRQQDWPWLAAIGVAGIIGQMLISESFRLAPPSIVAPFEYTALLWALIFDLLLWGLLPNTAMWPGAIVVVASGIYLVWREHLQTPQQARATVEVKPPAAPQN